MTGVQTCALPIFQIGVARAQCGGAKTAVQLGVAFITYANPAGVKQSNNRRDSFLPTDTRLLQVPLHARPQLGQRTAEPSAPVELENGRTSCWERVCQHVEVTVSAGA